MVSRVAMGLIVGATLVALALAARDAIRVDGRFTSSLDVLPLVETTINDLVLAGIAAFFLWTVPERLQPGRTLALLGLAAKTAAPCAEDSRDAVVLDTVNSIEELTTGMSRKIWQKISTLPPAA